MNIIFGKENLKALGDKHTSLEVDTIVVNGVSLECFCVISLENITLSDFNSLAETKELHQKMLDSFRNNDGNAASLIHQLKGRLQGSMDSFYDNLLMRIGTGSE